MTQIMGILNVTPDSFSDGGCHDSVAAGLDWARANPGADIIDIGGESTRPGAETVPERDEIARVVPVIRALRDAGESRPISIDTRKASVADAALEAGATMVNDVSGFTFDPALADVVAARDVPVCLMHAQGDPATMQDAPRYRDVVAEVRGILADRLAFARSLGIGQVILDPGIGFGKTLEHNLSLLRGLTALDLGVPLLLGASRKRFIGTLAGVDDPAQRGPGSVAVALHGADMGVAIVRVHDVQATRQAFDIWKQMRAA